MYGFEQILMSFTDTYVIYGRYKRRCGISSNKREVIL